MVFNCELLTVTYEWVLIARRLKSTTNQQALQICQKINHRQGADTHENLKSKLFSFEGSINWLLGFPAMG